jgi:hypothetical protein
MKRSPGVGLWIGSAFLAATALAALVIGIDGPHAKGIVAALRVTARFSYLLFWPAYAGASAKLFGARFSPLARREFGLAFGRPQASARIRTVRVSRGARNGAAPGRPDSWPGSRAWSGRIRRAGSGRSGIRFDSRPARPAERRP